jgi:prephenate dehydrogenase
MNITVIGLGLIGGSLARDLKKSGFATEVIGAESNPQHAADAVKLGIADRVVSLEEAVSETDLVILCTPVDISVVLLPRILDLIKSHTTVTDMGSVKRQLVGTVANHQRRKNYVAAHPMAGTEIPVRSSSRKSVQGKNCHHLRP